MPKAPAIAPATAIGPVVVPGANRATGTAVDSMLDDLATFVELQTKKSSASALSSNPAAGGPISAAASAAVAAAKPSAGRGSVHHTKDISITITIIIIVKINLSSR